MLIFVFLDEASLPKMKRVLRVTQKIENNPSFFIKNRGVFWNYAGKSFTKPLIYG